ncbi:hypothetical protein CR513_20225, partial [Mucuna pruriens]
SSSKPLHAFDPEIERTLHCLRKVRHTVTPDSSSFYSIWNSENSNFTTDESNFSEHQEAGLMENNDRALKELATPDVVYQPWCIQCPPLEPAQSYKLKSSLIHLLPKFHGLAGEDPHKHLKEFHMVCSTMRSQGIPKDHVKMKMELQKIGCICSRFSSILGGYEAHVPREILPGVQNSDHKEGDLWDQATLARHCMNTRRGLTSFVLHVHITRSASSLMMMDRSMIDAASGGALMDKMPAAA